MLKRMIAWTKRLFYKAGVRWMRYTPALWFPSRVRLETSGAGWGRLRFMLSCFAHINARGNVIVCGRNVWTRKFRVLMRGRGNRLEIGDGVRMRGFISINGAGVVVRIGHDFDAKSVKIVAWGADVQIGDGCLFAEDIEMRSGDIHRVLDAETEAWLNPPERIRVGDRVWVGSHVSFLKGAAVPEDSVVATRAVVTRPFTEPGTVLVGAPAHAARDGVVWRR